jgi:hypothetical protein
VIDRETWWKPFALALLLVAIGWAPLLLLDLIHADNRSNYDGFAMVWGLGPAAILTFSAALLIIGGLASLVIQYFRRD